MKRSRRKIGWKYDLPTSKTVPRLDAQLRELRVPPNVVDSIFLELPRSTMKIRGCWLAGMTGVLVLYGYLLAVTLPPPHLWTFDFIVTEFMFVVAMGAIAVPFIRMELGFPRDEPIRFNRSRRKVYFYQYNFDLVRPFGRKHWGIKTVAYDWDDLTAEAYRIYLPLGYGGIKEKVMISVTKTGTCEVIDRLYLCDDIALGESYWSIARAFMNQGASSLPPFVNPPKDWNEFPKRGRWVKAPHRNPFDRLAPEVKWPPEMDLESRTAGTAEHSP